MRNISLGALEPATDGGEGVWRVIGLAPGTYKFVRDARSEGWTVSLTFFIQAVAMNNFTLLAAVVGGLLATEGVMPELERPQ